MLDTHANKDTSPEEWDREGLHKAVLAQFGLDVGTLGIDWDTIVHDDLRVALVKGLVAPTRPRSGSSARSCASSSG